MVLYDIVGLTYDIVGLHCQSRWLESNDLKALQAEMAKLKAELRRTTEERDILNKAAAYFAKQSG